MKIMYTYHLCDNMGISTIELPILLNVRTQFEHEYGTYEVNEISKMPEGDIYIICERIQNDTYVIAHLAKHDHITLCRGSTLC